MLVAIGSEWIRISKRWLLGKIIGVKWIPIFKYVTIDVSNIQVAKNSNIGYRISERRARRVSNVQV